jgi:hypothetical protein
MVIMLRTDGVSWGTAADTLPAGRDSRLRQVQLYRLVVRWWARVNHSASRWAASGGVDP